MLYRYKVAASAGIVASFTFLLLYMVLPKPTTVPAIRVLYISYSDHSAIKRIRSSSGEFLDESLQVLQLSDDGSVTVSRDEWDLKSTPEEFYQNNLVLECTASFPVTWKYSGFGEPTVSEENVRIHGDFNDSNTYSYLSLLNLMPVTERSTGKYVCYGASNDTFRFSASVHLFIPGELTLLIDYDTTVEAPGDERIFVPCPVTNASTNVTLYFKNQAITSDNIQNLLTFDPQTGFYLKPRFMEEQSDPWGQFYCKIEDTKEKSGVVTIQPTKGLIVNVFPEGSTVLLTKPSSSNNKTHNKLEDQFKFICQAKEEISLKFLRVVTFPVVRYEHNASSSFPYSAYTEVSPKNFRNSSRIYCRTVKSNEDLHSWRILFSSLPMRSELMEFNYDSTKEEFACCSASNKKAKLLFLPCDSISQCRIKGNCLSPGRKCTSEEVTKLPVKSGCARHKIMKGDDKDVTSKAKNDRDEDASGDGIAVDSGLLQCTIDGKSVERVYFASRHESENGTVLNSVSDYLKDDTGMNVPAPFMNFNLTSAQLQIMEISEVPSADLSKKRFLCRGAKFFLAIGFIWQTIRADKEMRVYSGRDVIQGSWIQSQIQLPTFAANTSRALKRIYCIAPLWDSSERGWTHIKLELN